MRAELSSLSRIRQQTSMGCVVRFRTFLSCRLFQEMVKVDAGKGRLSEESMQNRPLGSRITTEG